MKVPRPDLGTGGECQVTEGPPHPRAPSCGPTVQVPTLWTPLARGAITCPQDHLY